MEGAPVKFTPQNGDNILMEDQAMSGIVVQPAGTVQYAQYVRQPEAALQNFLKAEAKTLGVIQIMIGLMYIGLLLTTPAAFHHYQFLLLIFQSYEFWAGVFFIISGSMTVSTEKPLTACKVKASVGLNILSALMALTGIILYCIHFYLYWVTGGNILFFLFLLLEFCIAVSTAHFGCKATCCKMETETIHVPFAIGQTNWAPAQGNPVPPPSYNRIESNVLGEATRSIAQLQQARISSVEHN